jgi:hypothetical protein
MNLALDIAAALVVVVTAAHSVLGERYLIGPLLRRGDLARVFGDARFAGGTLRVGWHITSIAWLGLAGVLEALAHAPEADRASHVAWWVGGCFLVQFVVALVASRGRHLSWIAFLAIGVLALTAGRA